MSTNRSGREAVASRPQPYLVAATLKRFAPATTVSRRRRPTPHTAGATCTAGVSSPDLGLQPFSRRLLFCCALLLPCFTIHSRAQTPDTVQSPTAVQVQPTPQATPLPSHFDSVKAVAFSPDGQTLVSASDDTALKFWPVSAQGSEQSKGAARVLVVGSSISCVAYRPDGALLATAGRDGVIRLWDVRSPKSWGRMVRAIPTGVKPLNALAWSPDGTTLVSGGYANQLLWLDAATGRTLHTLPIKEAPVALAFSPNGTSVAVAAGNALILYDGAQGRLERTLTGSQGAINALAWSRDGQSLAAGGWDKILRVWNVATGAVTHTLRGHPSWISAVAFRPDGQGLASAGWDKTVLLWSFSSDAAPRQLTLQSDTILSLAYSPDGQHLAWGGMDKTVHLYALATNQDTALPGTNSSGSDRRVTAYALYWQGKAASDAGEPTALDLLRRAVHLDNTNTAYTLALADSERTAGQFSAAQQLLTAYLKGTRSSNQRTALSGALADIHFDWAKSLQASQPAAALPHFVAALSFNRAAHSDKVAPTLYELGATQQSLGNNDLAANYYGQASALFRRADDAASESAALNGLGVAYTALSRYDKALPILQGSLALSRKAEDRASEGAALNSLGVAQTAVGQYPKAVANLKAALLIKRELQDSAGEGVALNNLGLAYQNQSQYEPAETNFEAALAIHQTTPNQRDLAATLNNLGANYHYLGEYRKAGDFFQRALDIHRKVGDRAQEANDLSNLGYAYFYLNQPQQAVRYLLPALLLRRQAQDRAGEGTTFGNLGAAYSALGRSQEALRFIAQSLRIAHAIGDREGEGVALYQQGLIELAQRQTAPATTDLRASLAIFREVGAPAREANALRALMLAAQTAHQDVVAIFYGKRAVNAYQSIRRTLGSLGQDIQKSFLASKSDTYRVLADLLVAQGRLPEAQQVLNLLKAEEYSEFVRGSDDPQGAVSLNSTEQEFETKYQQLGDLVTTIAQKRTALLAKKKAGALSAEDDAALTALNTQLTAAGQAFKAFLDQLTTQFAAEPEHRISDIKEARALKTTLNQLGAGTVALYTIVGKDRYTVILFTSDAERPATYTISAADLNREVQTFREILQDPTLDPVPQAKKLYKILLGPVEKELQAANAQTLMWSLDGALRYIPVAALHDDKGYLVERYRNVVFTPASLANLLKTPQATWSGLGMGVSQPHPGFNPLPDVPDELHGIIKDSTATAPAVLDGKVMLDAPFTQAAMLDSLQGGTYPVVHIASHFAFQPGNDTDSYLLLGDGNHLTLSTIEEQTNLFGGVELLTLSACNTANGGTGADGKEVDGLGVLAQQQGAVSVIATLWPVADESTSLLMRNFYRLRETQPELGKAEALRQAQLELLQGAATAKPTKERSRGNRGATIAGAGATPPNAPPFTSDPKTPLSHPYYWAPFILIGNWK